MLAALVVLGSSVPALADTRAASLETLASTRLAALDPAPAADIRSPAAPAAQTEKLYLSLDATGGVDDATDWLAAGGGVAAGYRLNDTLWVRGRLDTSARVGYGAINQGPTFHAPSQAHVDALVGLETRRCASTSACVTLGADAGIRSPDSRYGAGFEIVPRVGLDVGGEHVRFRPAIEAKAAWIRGFDTEANGVLPSLGIGVSLGAAYVW